LRKEKPLALVCVSERTPDPDVRRGVVCGIGGGYQVSEEKVIGDGIMVFRKKFKIFYGIVLVFNLIHLML